MLRDHWGHASSDSGVQLREIWVDSHVLSGGVQDGWPGPIAWQEHSILCVNPARSHSVQLTTKAGSTRCRVLIISFRMNIDIHIIMYKVCTLKVQSSIFHSSKVRHFWFFCLLGVFSVHFLELKQFLLYPLVFWNKSRITNVRTHTVSSRFKERKPRFSELKVLQIPVFWEIKPRNHNHSCYIMEMPGDK